MDFKILGKYARSIMTLVCSSIYRILSCLKSLFNPLAGSVSKKGHIILSLLAPKIFNLNFAFVKNMEVSSYIRINSFLNSGVGQSFHHFKNIITPCRKGLKRTKTSLELLTDVNMLFVGEN